MSAEAGIKPLIAISSEDEYGTHLKHAAGKLCVVHFYASWAPQCQQVDDVLIELSKESQVSDVTIIIKVEAESFPAISSKYEITAVPTCVLLKGDIEVDRVNGVKAAELTKKVRQHAGAAESGSSPSPAAEQTLSLNERLKKLVNQAPMMVFMKGSPDQPRCGFSRTLVQILGEQGATYSTFDILTDEEVRQGLKEYSNWPTYPQIYIKGELVGGLDIVKELIASGDFQSMLPQPAVKQSSLEERLKELINKDPVMLFMKGSPSNAKCGFSKTIVGVLNSKNIKYGHFDILEDEEVRQGLKTFSNWPTYPQLYVKGELVGGVDIVKDMNNSGELDKLLADFKV